MIPTPAPSRVAPAPAPVKVVQSAEMIGTSGIKAIFAIQGQLFFSLAPESPAEAQQINAALHTLAQP